MNKFLCALSVATALISVNALADQASDQRLAANLLREQFPAQSKIQLAMMIEAQKSGITTLTKFVVDWKTLECHAATPSEANPKDVGTCFVDASADKVSAEFAATIGADGLVVNALYVDIN
jgi:hypothetical protein